MATIAKILPIPVEYSAGEVSIQNSLAQHGKFMYPGTHVGIVPIKTASGKYLTGLDWEADYIKRLPKDQQAIEVKKIKERHDRLVEATGLDLGPRSEYYSGVYGIKYKTSEVASPVKLIDGENVFNFSSPQKEIEFWWVIQNTQLIASSLEAWKTGKAYNGVKFYVENATQEAELTYKNKVETNKAIIELGRMSIDKRRKVARLIGLPISENDKEEIVFNKLDDFLKIKEIKAGEYQGQNAVLLFNKMAALDNQLLDVTDLVNRAIKIRVLNQRTKDGPIYEGNNIIFQNKEAMISDYCLDSKQEELKALEIKVNDKIKMKELA